MRYPEDLFKLQRDILTRYHVDKPVDFYNQSDRWQVPTDPTKNTQDAQPPYYILAQRPGDERASFQLTSALNAFNRENLSSFISASSDPETYGQIQVLRSAGQHAVPRAAAGAAVVHHEQPGQTGPDAVQQPGLQGGLRQPAHAADRRERSALRRAAVRAGHRRRTPSRCCRRSWSTTATGWGTPTPCRTRWTRCSVPGAGTTATGGDTPTSPPTGTTPTPTTSAAPTTSPPAGGTTSPAMDQAVADIKSPPSRR